MPTGSARHQKSAQAQRPTEGRGEAASERRRDEAQPSGHDQTHWGPEDLLGQALTQQNMAAAWKRVKANKGSAGVDGRTVQQTGEDLQTQWPDIRRGLLDGTYRPSAVRRVGIPKPGGGTRRLGIPTVVDRLIQQALLQVLQLLIDPIFSEHSYGFRPGRSGPDRRQRSPLVAQQRTRAEPGAHQRLLRSPWRCPLMLTSTSRTAGADLHAGWCGRGPADDGRTLSRFPLPR